MAFSLYFPINDNIIPVILYLCSAARTAVFQMQGDNAYDHVWYYGTGMNEITFKVQACSEVQIALARYVGQTYDAYEVVIGAYNNKITAIRDKVGAATDVATQITTDILSCTEARWFWISWGGGRELLVGKGSLIGSHVILAWSEADASWAEAVSFTTSMNTKGLFEMTIGEGRATQQTRHIGPLLFQCWSSVDGESTLKQHWVNISCSLDQASYLVILSG